MARNSSSDCGSTAGHPSLAMMHRNEFRMDRCQKNSMYGRSYYRTLRKISTSSCRIAAPHMICC
eukprot:10075255-Prorocentrum_lima.AAC.1